MGRDADVDIGIIYTHETHFMTPLVSSLARSGDGLKMRLVLVDNAADGGVARWERLFPSTRVIRNERRLGYAPNLNKIIQYSTARYVLLLNTDMYFDPSEQCVARMVRFMDEHPECGVSNCRLFHRDGSDAFPARRFQTLGTILARRLGLRRLMPQLIDSYLYLDHRRDAVLDCDWLSGCFLMVRREALKEVGAFDCSFRMYFEDVDLCLRMALAGWRVMYNGQTYAYHFEQRASRQVFSRAAWLHLQSYVRWLAKWGFVPDQHVVTKPRCTPSPQGQLARESSHEQPGLALLRPSGP